VPPAEYADVKGNSCVIVCTRADKSITAYTTDGRKIGDFEMFTQWAGNYCHSRRQTIQNPDAQPMADPKVKIPQPTNNSRNNNRSRHR